MVRTKGLESLVSKYGVVSLITAYNRIRRGWSMEDAAKIPLQQGIGSYIPPRAKFGSLRVIRRAGSHPKYGGSLYDCECLLCGRVVTVLRRNLTTGRTTSCGCKSRRGASSNA